MINAAEFYEKMCDTCRLETQQRATYIAKHKIVNAKDVYHLIDNGLCNKCKRFLRPPLKQ